MKKTELEKQIEDTLQSIDGLPLAKAPDGFLSKLESRLIFANRENKKWLNGLKVGVAAMIVMSLINGYLLLPSAATDQVNIEDFTSEYFESDTDLIEF